MDLREHLEALSKDQIAAVVQEYNHLSEHGIRPKFSTVYHIAHTICFFIGHKLRLDDTAQVVERFCLQKAATLWLESYTQEKQTKAVGQTE